MEKSLGKRLKWWQHVLQFILIFTGIVAGVGIYLYVASYYVVDDDPEADLVVQQQTTKPVREEQRVLGLEAQQEQIVSPPEKQLPVIRQEDIYEVILFEEGFRLTSLAKEYFKNKVFWVYIYDFNRDKVDNPNAVPIGTSLKIPVPEYYTIDADDPQSVNRAAILQRKIQEEYR